MANDVVMPYTLANGPGNVPDATKWNDNYTKCNDKIYISTTAPTTPYNGQIWFKHDEDPTIALRIYRSADSSWYAIPLAVIG
jgi:hypothetical protein